MMQSEHENWACTFLLRLSVCPTTGTPLPECFVSLTNLGGSCVQAKKILEGWLFTNRNTGLPGKTCSLIVTL